MLKYRKLDENEITLLQANNCRCDDWNNVSVADNFSPEYVKNNNFSGEVYLGAFTEKHILPGNVVIHSGISDATIHNCTIKDNVYINHVHGYLANYIIEENCLIYNVDVMAVDGDSSFGNGVTVTVMCETGGREVKIYDELSAHTAYIMAMYRDRKDMIGRLNAMVDEYSLGRRSSIGRVGQRCVISGCKEIKNVNFGDGSRIENAFRLKNGTVNSAETSPSYIGIGVIAENFIVSSDTKITDGVLLFNCFVGQGCELGRQYSAENSLFFANCAGFHGEACSIFAGPYTVTHHKSTLLIAGQFSFMNAGSGSNQSNHMYKLGPIHQGILERGSKTASDSYILWPAKIGPFTVVMGRHTANIDSSDLPFSYLIENNDESIIVPAINLKSVGTIRDAQKWPHRDRRKSDDVLDCINFNLLSPFTINRMFNGIEVLQLLQESSGYTSQWYTYRSMKMKNSSLCRAIDLYKLGIMKFLGNSLISRIENIPITTDEDLVKALMPDSETGIGEWLDIAGLIAPKTEIKKVLDEVDNGSLKLNDINRRFKEINSNYYSYEWTWALKQIEDMLGKPFARFTKQDVVTIVERWKTAVITLDNMLYEDAKKEFNLISKTGFGADGNAYDCNL
ncbi:MAG: DUF4954 family protein, partial [Bacteroidales bacterium]|nr:DUF4954 family protein [Bacteroidales bacterium]